MGRWSERAGAHTREGERGATGEGGRPAAADAGAAAGAHSLRTNELNEQILGDEPGEAEGEGGCPRCERLSRQAAEVLAELKAHPALPPALRCLPPEKLGILVRWTVVSLTNPRPAWPPPRPTDAKRKHRRLLDGVIEDLGGHASGAEPPSALEEWDDAGD
jgi:hypothetical protein